MTASVVDSGGVIDWINDTSADVVEGQVVSLGTRAAVALTDIADGATGAVATQGIFRTAKDGSAITVNAPVDWDFSELELSASAHAAAGDIADAGVCVKVAADTDAYVDWEINATIHAVTGS